MRPNPKLTGAMFADARLDMLFPSPVMAFDWPSGEHFNRGLRDAILRRRERSAGVVKTNRGGWQSDVDLQDWDSSETGELIQRVQSLAHEYLVRQAKEDNGVFRQGWQVLAWANVNEHGHFNRSHSHLGAYAQISAIYYVDVGDIQPGRDAGGRTRFEDWTAVAIDVDRNPDVLRRDVLMQPSNGRMLMFPASLMHSVERYQGHSPRVTVAFNLFHPALAVPRLGQHIGAVGWWATNFRGLVMLRRKLPEKVYAVGLLPRLLWRPWTAQGSWMRHAALAWATATALASEHFEARANGQVR